MTSWNSRNPVVSASLGVLAVQLSFCSSLCFLWLMLILIRVYLRFHSCFSWRSWRPRRFNNCSWFSWRLGGSILVLVFICVHLRLSAVPFLFSRFSGTGASPPSPRSGRTQSTFAPAARGVTAPMAEKRSATTCRGMPHVMKTRREV